MQNLVSVSSEGGSSAAIETMNRAIPGIIRGIRRGVPFIARRQIEVVPHPPVLVDAKGVTEALVPPLYAVPLAAEPGGNRGYIAVDGRAISFLLEGTLGGDGRELPQLAPERVLTTLPMSRPMKARDRKSVV